MYSVMSLGRAFFGVTVLLYQRSYSSSNRFCLHRAVQYPFEAGLEAFASKSTREGSGFPSAPSEKAKREPHLSTWTLNY